MPLYKNIVKSIKLHFTAASSLKVLRKVPFVLMQIKKASSIILVIDQSQTIRQSNYVICFVVGLNASRDLKLQWQMMLMNHLTVSCCKQNCGWLSMIS